MFKEPEFVQCSRERERIVVVVSRPMVSQCTRGHVETRSLIESGSSRVEPGMLTGGVAGNSVQTIGKHARA
jgi:hypothetical protein